MKELTPAQIKRRQKKDDERLFLEEQQLQLQKQKERDYLPILMNTLERVLKTSTCATLDVENGLFVLATELSQHHLSPSYCRDSYDSLHELNMFCDRLDEQREQERRDYQARQVALSKLSKEEIRLLGIQY